MTKGVLRGRQNNVTKGVLRGMVVDSSWRNRVVEEDMSYQG